MTHFRPCFHKWQYAEQLARIPEFAKFGDLIKSSKSVALTEAETEYNVTVLKHVFPKHLVLQFDCRNTLQDQLLENVTVAVTTDSTELRRVHQTTIPRLVYNERHSCYVAYAKAEGSYVAASFNNTLKFLVKDCDPETFEADPEGYDDVYQLEEFALGLGDYMAPLSLTQFKDTWEELGDANQVTETYQLSALQTLPGI